MTNVELVSAYRGRLAETLPRVRARIDRAARVAGRPADAICLVAVTKGHPIEAVLAARQAGLVDLGENRVEEMEGKVAETGRDGFRWHLIGHLQSRKVKRALAVADLIHSVDSPRLAERLARAVVDGGLPPARVLLQVNSSGEESKGGFALESAIHELAAAAALEGLAVQGLMTMAPFTDDERVLRSSFGRLREALEALRRANPAVGGDLSMGMTNDLDVAIEEGSTMVRVGTALFGERV